MPRRTIIINIHGADETTVIVDGLAQNPTSWLTVHITEEKEVNVFLTPDQMRFLANSLNVEASRHEALVQSNEGVNAEEEVVRS